MDQANFDKALVERIAHHRAELRIAERVAPIALAPATQKPLANIRRLGLSSVSLITMAVMNAGHETDEMRQARATRANVQDLIARTTFSRERARA